MLFLFDYQPNTMGMFESGMKEVATETHERFDELLEKEKPSWE